MDVGVLPADLGEDAAPEVVGRDRVRLVHQRELPPGAPAGELEGVPDDPFRPVPRIEHLLKGHFVGRPLLEEAADTDVAVLGVLPAHDEVDLLRALPLEGGEGLGEAADGAEVHVEVETEAEGSHHGALDQADWKPRVSDGAKVDGVLLAVLVQGAFRHEDLRLEVVVRGPWVVGERKGEAVEGGRGAKDLEAFREDLGADPVARDHGDGVVPSAHLSWGLLLLHS